MEVDLLLKGDGAIDGNLGREDLEDAGQDNENRDGREVGRGGPYREGRTEKRGICSTALTTLSVGGRYL
jgi:hypothetical protein